MANAPIILPNHDILFAGNSSAGFYGEVESSNFITGSALASQLGLTTGVGFNSNVNWMKFSLDKMILFSPKKPIRHTISWNQINQVDAVFGNRTIVINGRTYKVRLFKGAQTNPSIDTDVDKDAIGSEWNRLMLPISVEAPNSFRYPQYTGTIEDWNINYTNEDLGHAYNAPSNPNNYGHWNWCQETLTSNTSYRVRRGNEEGVSHSGEWNSGGNYKDFGWRPVLELVEEDPTKKLPSVKINSQWRSNRASLVKINGIWRNVKSIHTKIDGQWK